MDRVLRDLRALEMLDHKIWSEKRKLKTEKNQKIRHRLYKRIGTLNRRYEMMRQQYLMSSAEANIQNKNETH